jgi:hypothetical protein
LSGVVGLPACADLDIVASVVDDVLHRQDRTTAQIRRPHALRIGIARSKSVPDACRRCATRAAEGAAAGLLSCPTGVRTIDETDA